MKLKIPRRRIQCKDCGEIKSSKEFHWRIKDSGTTLDSRTCLECKKNNSRITRQYKKQYSEPKNGKCECCGKVAKLHCDHTHKGTKKFRGYLCRACNVGIGNLGDSIDNLIKGIGYLSKTFTPKRKKTLLNKIKKIL